MTKDVTLRASLMVAGGGDVIRGTNSFPVTSRAAVVYAHKNETIDVITSKDRRPTGLVTSWLGTALKETQ